jgi:iron complex transport system substrate-binding protein
VEGRSVDIDRGVKALLERALSVYSVDAEMLRALRPDVIVTQSQCEVCAVSTKDVEEAVCGWVESRPRIVSLAPDGLDDVWSDVRRVAEALGEPTRGAALVEGLRGRMAALGERAGGLSKPTVACIEWIDPLMASGNWMPELVGMAGGVNLFGEAGRHAPWMSWEELVERDPEVIVALPCGFDIPRTREEMPTLSGREGWRSLRAVRAGRVAVTDGNQYFNRPGPRLAESLEILAEILHPDAFSFGHQGRGWEPYV